MDEIVDAFEKSLNKRAHEWKPTKTSWIQLGSLILVLMIQIVGVTVAFTTVTADLRVLTQRLDYLDTTHTKEFVDIRANLQSRTVDRYTGEDAKRDKASFAKDVALLNQRIDSNRADFVEIKALLTTQSAQFNDLRYEVQRISERFSRTVPVKKGQ